jgi:K+-transporting ATPase KdpF subunit
VRPRVGEAAMFDYIVSGIVSVLLLVYLGWAMFQPEKF